LFVEYYRKNFFLVLFVFFVV